MTTKTNRSSRAIAAELASINAELEAAREDMALLERLKSAADRVTRLSVEQDKKLAAHRAALAAEAEAKVDARFAGISDVDVTDSTPMETVLRSSFQISFIRPVWDGYRTAPKRHSANGFGVLPPEVLDYLITRCPERIPAKIMALAPDSPREAFNRYFVGVRRGYIAA